MPELDLDDFVEPHRDSLRESVEAIELALLEESLLPASAEPSLVERLTA